LDKQTLKAYSPTAFSLPCKVSFTGCAGTDGPRGMPWHTLPEDGQSVTWTSKPVECLIHQFKKKKEKFGEWRGLVPKSENRIHTDTKCRCQ